MGVRGLVLAVRGSICAPAGVLVGVLAGALVFSSAPAVALRVHSSSSSFGEAGAGDGQLSSPGWLAVNDSTGDVYVVDRGNLRVEEFSSAGAYLSQFNGSASPSGAFSPGGGRPPAHSIDSPPPEAVVAVDNSTDPSDPSAGDVYVLDPGHNVIDKFTANGVYVSQLPFGNEGGKQESIHGLAVDQTGQLRVSFLQHGTSNLAAEGLRVRNFSDAVANAPLSTHLIEPSTHQTLMNMDIGDGLAVDPEGDLYALIHLGGGSFPFLGETEILSKVTPSGSHLVDAIDEEVTTAAAVDESSGEVFVDNETSVAAFDSEGNPVERFGSGAMAGSYGVAVDSATGTVYVTNAPADTVEVFPAKVLPDVSTGSASGLGETSASVSGSVNPDGISVTSCEFEYGTSTSYGLSVPCSPAPGSGGVPVPVSASLTGLEKLTRYHYRLVAANANGTNLIGGDRTFMTPRPAAIAAERALGATSSSVTFAAEVAPGGSDTSYHFEYGPTTSYGASIPVPDADAGSSVGGVPVGIQVEGLQPSALYHFRIVASNALGLGLVNA
jgi:hypothetical protein